MYRDNSLVPVETVRIAALGALATRPRRYAEIAADVRLFTSRMVGPSLELMVSSIEMLRAEGLIEAMAGDPDQADPRLTLTEEGRATLLRLLRAGLRAPNSDLNRLVVALKMRFLHLLTPPERREQLALLDGALKAERERLVELREQGEGAPVFEDWLELQITLLDQRIGWLADCAARHGF